MSVTRPLTELTAREEAFVLEYMVSLNPMEAYVKAGYSAKTARQNAYRMMDRDGS